MLPTNLATVSVPQPATTAPATTTAGTGQSVAVDSVSSNPIVALVQLMVAQTDPVVRDSVLQVAMQHVDQGTRETLALKREEFLDRQSKADRTHDLEERRFQQTTQQAAADLDEKKRQFQITSTLEERKFVDQQADAMRKHQLETLKVRQAHTQNLVSRVLVPLAFIITLIVMSQLFR